MEERLFTVEEVADYLRISQETVRRLLRSGQLVGVHIGRTWRVPLSELESLRMEKEKEPDKDKK